MHQAASFHCNAGLFCPGQVTGAAPAPADMPPELSCEVESSLQKDAGVKVQGGVTVRFVNPIILLAIGAFKVKLHLKHKVLNSIAFAPSAMPRTPDKQIPLFTMTRCSWPGQY